MTKINNIYENGRSIVEVLGILAVIGVLSVGGVKAYRYAFHKHNANVIIQDAHLAYTELHGMINNQPHPWTAVTWEAKSHKTIETLRDNDGDDYVKVIGIDEEDCKQILLMSVPPRITLFDENAKRFEVCAESNNIVFAFDGVRVPGINCETGSDCAQMGMYCQSVDKICKTCAEGYKINAKRNGCDRICQLDTQTTCELDKNYWCCDHNLICGTTVEECQESDGFCAYKINQQKIEATSDCSYLYIQQEQTISSDCQYEVKNTTDGAIVTPKKKCPQGQFCNLRFTDEKCQNTLTDSSNGTMYGICSARNLPLSSCLVSSVSNPMKLQKGCPKGQYCNLAYTDELCTAKIPNDLGANIMYGVCSALYNPSSNCPIQKISNAVSPIKKCPQTKYCNLFYTDETCTTPADNNGANILYGICNKKDSANKTCPTKK